MKFLTVNNFKQQIPIPLRNALLQPLLAEVG